MKDKFGFAEHQETGTYGLGYKLPLTRNTDNAVLIKDNAINNGKIKFNAIEWYVPHYTPSLAQLATIFELIQSKTLTEVQYPGSSVFMKEKNTQNFWSFRLSTQEGINIPIWISAVFRQSDREPEQNLNDDTFCRLPVTSAQCIIGTERYPDSAIVLNYDDDDYSQGNDQTKKAFRDLTKNNILQRCIS